MKSFLKKLLLFLVPCVLFVLFLEIYLRRLNTAYSEKAKGLISYSDSIELIILGNSHATFGIDPNQFDLYSYNLAQVSQSLYYDKRLTLKHLDRLTNLKFVIITLDFHSLYFSSQGNRDLWSYYGNGIEYKEDFSFLSKHSRLMGYTLKIAINLIQKDMSKKYKKIKAVDVEKGVNLNQPIRKGWLAYEGTHQSAMNEATYKSRADDFYKLVKDSKEKKDVMRDLEDFIRILKARNITPILLTIPCYSTYRKMLNEKQMQQNNQDVMELTQKFGIDYWNYFDLPLDETNFWNCDHLNRKGAENFSKILNQRIAKLSAVTKSQVLIDPKPNKTKGKLRQAL